MTTPQPGQVPIPPPGNPFATPQPTYTGTPYSYPPPPPLPCQFCGTHPATDVTFRAHQGLLIMMKFQKVGGVMCRTCGEAVYRTTQGRTLWQGWWSPFSLFLFTPGTLLWNLVARRKAQKIPPPLTGHPGLDQGKPLHRRPLVRGTDPGRLDPLPDRDAHQHQRLVLLGLDELVSPRGRRSGTSSCRWS
ncbi:hypothetical protein [Streptomyces sp. NPDC055189]